MESYESLIKNIPPSASDEFLEKRGYDLRKEYYDMINAADFDKKEMIFDFATGSGRMVSVLTRIGYEIITADITDEQRPEAVTRIKDEYMDKVKFTLMNLESVPYKDNSLLSIETVNTVHHLENPVECIKELIRINKREGKILVADFNDEGFDLMDKVHMSKYGKLHTRGISVWPEIFEMLKSSYKSVREFNTRLNNVLIAWGKI